MLVDVLNHLQQQLGNIERKFKGKTVTFGLLGIFSSFEYADSAKISYEGLIVGQGTFNEEFKQFSAGYVAPDLISIVKTIAEKQARGNYRVKVSDSDFFLTISASVTPEQLQQEEEAIKQFYGEHLEVRTSYRSTTH